MRDYHCNISVRRNQSLYSNQVIRTVKKNLKVAFSSWNISNYCLSIIDIFLHSNFFVLQYNRTTALKIGQRLTTLLLTADRSLENVDWDVGEISGVRLWRTDNYPEYNQLIFNGLWKHNLSLLSHCAPPYPIYKISQMNLNT